VIAFVISVGILVEASLQIGAVVVRWVYVDEPPQWMTPRPRVLCIGDSHTYGLWVDREQAYPQQLEALWNEEKVRPLIEVMNLGFSGVNSGQLVRDLPRMIDAFEPDVVIILVGVNDYWTRPVVAGRRCRARIHYCENERARTGSTSSSGARCFRRRSKSSSGEAPMERAPVWCASGPKSFS
jgi:lysophospholipase L1-like esterase